MGCDLRIAGLGMGGRVRDHGGWAWFPWDGGRAINIACWAIENDGRDGRLESLFRQAHFGGCSIYGGSTEHEGAGGVIAC